MLVDHLEKYGLFLIFQYGFRSSCLTAGLLIVVSDRIAWVFNRPGLLELKGLVFKAINRVYHAGFLLNSRLIEFQVLFVSFFFNFSVIDCCDWFMMEPFYENTQLMLVFLKASFSFLHLSYMH